MCKSVNLSWNKAVQNAGSVFAYFCGGHKNDIGYILVAPLETQFFCVSFSTLTESSSLHVINCSRLPRNSLK